MRIFYASAIEQGTGWGAEWFLNRSFRALNHTTHCLDYRVNRHSLYRRFLQVPQCDAFLLQRGDFFPIPLVKAVQVPKFFWDTELPNKSSDHERILRSGLFDHLFFYTREFIEGYVERGWVERHRCSVLLGGFDPSFHRPLPNVDKDIGILFVGSVTPRRRKVLDIVQKRFRLVVASAFGSDMVQLFNRARIVLNIHAEDFLTVETRVFEALGCGAFLLTEKLSPENPFSKDELVEFDTHDDLCDKLQYFPANVEEMSTVAERGRIAALRSHTYGHRAEEIVRVISAYVNGQSGQHRETVRRSWRLHAYGMSEPFLQVGDAMSIKAMSFLSRAKRFIRSVVQV